MGQALLLTRLIQTQPCFVQLPAVPPFIRMRDPATAPCLRPDSKGASIHGRGEHIACAVAEVATQRLILVVGTPIGKKALILRMRGTELGQNIDRQIAPCLFALGTAQHEAHLVYPARCLIRPNRCMVGDDDIIAHELRWIGHEIARPVLWRHLFLHIGKSKIELSIYRCQANITTP